ncbi:response regulator [Actinosynnema sp. CA-299493]|uniref:LuxR family two component transcriptional regulator n=1 Tax=Saccharothrix texasensis TaxID=103734 RepID=A0A3N1H0H0_9PSEU|nr:MULTISPECIES: response regulator transcription factor [Saccharothrix]QQQ79232.1 response regulator transcription factor [Saccharothrix sp. 6-C]ROP35974.1 LuxR family two component transcriptional regulator [Saccharothrix texasensis]
MSIRVLVVDDHAAIRAGLVLILGNAEGIEVVGEAGDGATAISQARALRPDVVLMDIRMPGLDGIAATKALHGDSVAQVLVLTTFDLDEYVFAALRAGAAGFLLKSVDAPRLVEAVRLVAAGENVLGPEITRKLIKAYAEAPVKTQPVLDSRLDQLTERELDVLRCLGRGLSNAQIAHELFISGATAKTHVSRILTKLDLRSRVQAAIYAQENDLV